MHRFEMILDILGLFVRLSSTPKRTRSPVRRSQIGWLSHKGETSGSVSLNVSHVSLKCTVVCCCVSSSK